MSDRIDELVAAIDANTLLQWDGKDVALEAAHELATIARGADKWRKVAAAAKAVVREATGHRDRDVAVAVSALAAAIAAIEQEEAE